MHVFRFSPSRRTATALIIAASALLGGCVTKNDPQTTGSIGSTRLPGKAAASETAIINQAGELRAAGRKAEAVSLLAAAAGKPKASSVLMAAYGRALADAGQNEQALTIIRRAHDPRAPDWRLLNTEGALLDQLGRFDEAQQRYSAALALAPGEPAVLTNYGLSMALAQRPVEAEKLLRQAVASPAATPKMRQNLALVLALQGRTREAEEIARKDLSPEEVAANMAYWKAGMKPAAAALAKPARPALPEPEPEAEPLALRS